MFATFKNVFPDLQNLYVYDSKKLTGILEN
jgi:hypothetical protein